MKHRLRQKLELLWSSSRASVCRQVVGRWQLGIGWVKTRRVEASRACHLVLPPVRACAGLLCLRPEALRQGANADPSGKSVGHERQVDTKMLAKVWLPVAAGAIGTRALCIMLLRAWLQWALVAGISIPMSPCAHVHHCGPWLVECGCDCVFSHYLCDTSYPVPLTRLPKTPRGLVCACLTWRYSNWDRACKGAGCNYVNGDGEIQQGHSESKLDLQDRG